MSEWRPLELDLPADDTAPTLARAAASATLNLPTQRAEDVALMLSEVVTNAVCHTGMAPTEDIVVRMAVEREVLRVEVWDRGGGFDPDALPTRTGDVGGWGLQIVDGLADRWGVETDDGETVVWFEVSTRPDLLLLP